MLCNYFSYFLFSYFNLSIARSHFTFSLSFSLFPILFPLARESAANRPESPLRTGHRAAEEACPRKRQRTPPGPSNVTLALLVMPIVREYSGGRIGDSDGGGILGVSMDIHRVEPDVSFMFFVFVSSAPEQEQLRASEAAEQDANDKLEKALEENVCLYIHSFLSLLF